MDYGRHGSWKFGRNRHFADQQVSPIGSGPRYALFRKSEPSVLGTFDRHEDAMAERERLQHETDDEFVVHKLW